MKCLFCNNLIPPNRKKYCSTICVKRAWQLRHYPNTKSYFAKNPDFWKTETGIGFRWEKWGAKLLKAKHLKFNKNGGDLDWNGKIVDVKSSILYKRKIKRNKPVKSEQAGCWGFNRGKIKPIDYFLCICVLNDKPKKVLLIPNNKFSKTGIVIGHKSKYDKFKIPF